jgi:hypothetical protein
MRSRSPRALRPCVRATFVSQLSSMKTRLEGSRLGCAANQAPALAQYVRAILLDRAFGHSFRVRPWRWKKRDTGRARGGDAALGQTGLKLPETLVAPLLKRGHDVRMPRLDPS